VTAPTASLAFLAHPLLPRILPFALAPIGRFLGCYNDTAVRALQTLLTPPQNDPTITPGRCSLLAAWAGYQFAGVQNGNQCWAGNTLSDVARFGSNTTSTTSLCTSSCPGSSGLAAGPCGGPWANSVFEVAPPRFVGCVTDESLLLSGSYIPGSTPAEGVTFALAYAQARSTNATYFAMARYSSSEGYLYLLQTFSNPSKLPVSNTTGCLAPCSDDNTRYCGAGDTTPASRGGVRAYAVYEVAPCKLQ
jgi:hypothetical protein